MTALARHSRGSMPAGCVCHVHTHPGNATAHSVRPPHSTAYLTAGSPPPCAFAST